MIPRLLTPGRLGMTLLGGFRPVSKAGRGGLRPVLTLFLRLNGRKSRTEVSDPLLLAP